MKNIINITFSSYILVQRIEINIPLEESQLLGNDNINNIDLFIYIINYNFLYFNYSLI